MADKVQPVEEKVCLLGLSEDEICAFVLDLGMPKFVGRQIAHWIYKHRADSFEKMKNVSLQNREKLSQVARVGLHAPVQYQLSSDGTKKYLYKTLKGNYVETVFIPSGDRATLCVSCQVGCKMGCKFCMTGRQTWQESLTTSDILNQILSLPEFDKLTNLVFMGQGEPFDNTDCILKALHLLTAENGLAWSPRRITVSTVGLIPGMRRFLDETSCHLAISLHNPFPMQRGEYMPVEKAFGIGQVTNVLRQYDCFRKRPYNADTTRQRRLSFEYIMFKGLNDTKAHAQELIQMLKDFDCRINLIRFHKIPDSPFEGTSPNEMELFRDYLTKHGVYTTIRASRGEDILAACGMLSTKAQQSEQSHFQ